VKVENDSAHLWFTTETDDTMAANAGSYTEVEGAVLDYYYCGISQLPDDKFSSDICSDLCPVVGLCGHSYAKGNLKTWAIKQERQRTIMPCPLKCSHVKISRDLGIATSHLILAFRIQKLAPNYSLCVAIDEIDFLKSKLQEARTERQTKAIQEQAIEWATFHKCPKCEEEFSTESKNANGGRPAPNAAIVGVCGHTYCLNCIYDMHADALSRTKSNTMKKFACSECEEERSFHSEIYCENIGLRHALLYWDALRRGRIDLQDEEEESVTGSGISEEATRSPPVRQTRIKREEPCSQWTIQETEETVPTERGNRAQQNLVVVKVEDVELVDASNNSFEHDNNYEGETSVQDTDVTRRFGGSRTRPPVKEEGTDGPQIGNRSTTNEGGGTHVEQECAQGHGQPKEEEPGEGEHTHESESDGGRPFDNHQQSIDYRLAQDKTSHQRTFTSLKVEASEDEHVVTKGAIRECSGDQLECTALDDESKNEHNNDGSGAEVAPREDEYLEESRQGNTGHDRDDHWGSPRDSSNQLMASNPNEDDQIICLVCSSGEESSAEGCPRDLYVASDQEEEYDEVNRAVEERPVRIAFNHGRCQEPNAEQEVELRRLLEDNQLVFLCLNEFDTKLQWGVYDLGNHLVCKAPDSFVKQLLGERRYNYVSGSSKSTAFVTLQCHKVNGRNIWLVKTHAGDVRVVDPDYVPATFRREFIEKAEARPNRWLQIQPLCRVFPRIDLSSARFSLKHPVIWYRFEQESSNWKLVHSFASAVHVMGRHEEAKAMYENLKSAPSDERQIERLHKAVTVYLPDHQLRHEKGGAWLHEEASCSENRTRVFRVKLFAWPGLTCFIVVFNGLVFEPMCERALPATEQNLGFCCACPGQIFGVEESWTLEALDAEQKPMRKRHRKAGHGQTKTDPFEVVLIND
jgi:RING-type zinc-finger